MDPAEQKPSFIETQFPVSKVSKESYKERKANNSQTLTGLGKWWGRKPLILVRAAVLGCLMPAGDQKKDTDIFLKLLSMDEAGLEQRKDKKFSIAQLYDIVCNTPHLHEYKEWFDISSGKPKLDRDAPRKEMEMAAFKTLGYDDKIAMCKRPEHVELELEWDDINSYFDTHAHSLPELIHELSMTRFGHAAVIGDCFCGGGSIPFEAARIGYDVYASDLNPIAGLLTWADMHICGASEQERQEIEDFQTAVYQKVDEEITRLGVEVNGSGDRALSYLYCNETKCPECGFRVPLAPSWVIGKGTKSIVTLVEADGCYTFKVKMGVSSDELNAASEGTVRNNAIICPHCGKSTPLSAIRHDIVTENGGIQYGLRMWDRSEFEARPDDVFTERLYAVKFERSDGSRYYAAPDAAVLASEEKIRQIVSQNLAQWQVDGLIPSAEIEEGLETTRLLRERGWKYWHQLFNPRQLLLLSLFVKAIAEESSPLLLTAGILGLHKCIDWDSKLSRWHNGTASEIPEQTFYNQALNTLLNYGTRSLAGLKTSWFYDINSVKIPGQSQVRLCDARDVETTADIWITDPPYADAVNYHELSEFFLAWDRHLLLKAFPDWYADSKRVLAVRGGEHFSDTMIEIYSNLARHMPDNGMQIVMFTHSDPAVWAQLALIMWNAGLKVTAAWNIATETDASGLKNGNYVKGTVLLVLRKRTGDDSAFLDEINGSVRIEVRRQIDSMQELDDREDPNFSDPDYVLAAYAASLKVLTSFSTIEDLDLDYELAQAISNPAGSAVVKIIENAKKIAYDCVIPRGFSSYEWRDLCSAEKFYIKGLESEKQGSYQISTYQEFARGFSIGGYSQLMASQRANTARLKTPFEMAGRTLGDVPDFQHSLMRTVFQGIYAGIKEDMNPAKALGFVKSQLPNYWDRRSMICRILSFITDTKDITNMKPHWETSAQMAELLLAAVTHDSV